MEALFEALKNWCLTYGYPVLFAGVLLENAGVPVPGETAVLVAGFMASAAGEQRFSLLAVIVITVIAAVLGDNLGFWLGYRWARPKLQKGKRFLFLTPAAMQMAEGYFRYYGTWTIFFARFITGLRVIGALAAGTAAMSWPRFLVANAAGAITWAVSIALLGYFFGQHWRLLEQWLTRTGLIALGVAVLLICLAFCHGRLRRFLAVPSDEESDASKKL